MAQQRKRISNRAIIWLKLISALGLFFSCCLFFFLNYEIFVRDLGFDDNAPLGSAANPWWHVLYPIAFLLGICFIIYYITNMVVRFEIKELWKADRMFIAYQLVFTGILMITIWRWFFVNVTNAKIPSIIMLVSGAINLLTPKIIDNDNTDF